MKSKIQIGDLVSLNKRYSYLKAESTIGLVINLTETITHYGDVLRIAIVLIHGYKEPRKIILSDLTKITK